MAFTTGRFMSSLALLFVLIFYAALFSIWITLLGKERAGLRASRGVVCLCCTRYNCAPVSSSLCQGLAANCVCGTP